MNMKNLGLGCMRLPLRDENDPSSIDMEQFCQMTDLFLEEGFTYFDTAYMYHDFKSECAIKQALVDRHPRESFLLASKMPIMFVKKQEDQERIFQEQLDKCGVDYFDYYLIHNLGVNHYEIAKKMDTFSFVQEKKKEGKIRHVGFSYHDGPELLEEILTEHPEVEFVQLQLNYLDWDNESIQSRKCYEVARNHRKPVIVMEPVKGGTLARIPQEAEKLFKEYHPELSVPSWAVRYAASHEGVEMVLSGTSNLDQLKDNISFMKEFRPLDQKELDIIDQVVEIINGSISIPCTACEYCVGGCPQNIAIPKYFALYNAEKQALNAMFSTQYEYYLNYCKDYGKASDCIACGQCEEACPQHIRIIDELKKVAAAFETL